jgi:hypothetical protein
MSNVSRHDARACKIVVLQNSRRQVAPSCSLFGGISRGGYPLPRAMQRSSSQSGVRRAQRRYLVLGAHSLLASAAIARARQASSIESALVQVCDAWSQKSSEAYRRVSQACALVVQFLGRNAHGLYARSSWFMSVAANPSIERTSYRRLRRRQAAAHVER